MFSQDSDSCYFSFYFSKQRAIFPANGQFLSVLINQDMCVLHSFCIRSLASWSPCMHGASAGCSRWVTNAGCKSERIWPLERAKWVFFGSKVHWLCPSAVEVKSCSESQGLNTAGEESSCLFNCNMYKKKHAWKTLVCDNSYTANRIFWGTEELNTALCAHPASWRFRVTTPYSLHVVDKPANKRNHSVMPILT